MCKMRFKQLSSSKILSKMSPLLLMTLVVVVKNLDSKLQSFLGQYQKIEELFQLSRLKESPELRVKMYRESVYYGEIKNGKKHGLGVLVYKDGRIYEGQWSQDTKKGHAAQKFPNGSVFKGEYLFGKPHGTGSYIWGNGERYDGQWINGIKNGSGMWRGQKGDSYKGEWKYGKPDGYGVHTWPNGDTYEGEFRDCLKHGEGLERFANGDMYKGSYINGKPSGYGEYFWFNGSFFKGNFMNGLREGKGIWRRGTGNNDSYEGGYRNDKKWGYGVFKWASGNIYKGTYELDMRNKYGEMYWKNGSYYKGNWANGIQHGQGEIYLANQGFKKGRFDNNTIVEVWEEKLIPRDNPPKYRLRMKTQTGTKQGLKNKMAITRHKTTQSNKPAKRMSEEALRRKTSPRNQNQKKSMNHQQSLMEVRQFKRDQKCQKRMLFDQKDTFAPKYDVISRQKLNTYSSQDIDSDGRQMLKTQSSHCSKSRLLHSSFYLYKLNRKHQFDSNMRRKETESQNVERGQAPILFMGKLYPQSK